ncbi:unnamed protein product, partial [Durusdinium trenchii]
MLPAREAAPRREAEGVHEDVAEFLQGLYPDGAFQVDVVAAERARPALRKQRQVRPRNPDVEDAAGVEEPQDDLVTPRNEVPRVQQEPAPSHARKSGAMSSAEQYRDTAKTTQSLRKVSSKFQRTLDLSTDSKDERQPPLQHRRGTGTVYSVKSAMGKDAWAHAVLQPPHHKTGHRTHGSRTARSTAAKPRSAGALPSTQRHRMSSRNRNATVTKTARLTTSGSNWARSREDAAQSQDESDRDSGSSGSSDLGGSTHSAEGAAAATPQLCVDVGGPTEAAPSPGPLGESRLHEIERARAAARRLSRQQQRQLEQEPQAEGAASLPQSSPNNSTKSWSPASGGSFRSGDNRSSSSALAAARAFASQFRSRHAESKWSTRGKKDGEQNRINGADGTRAAPYRSVDGEAGQERGREGTRRRMQARRELFYAPQAKRAAAVVT